MKQLTRSEFNKDGTTYKSVTSPATDSETTQISDIVIKNDHLAYSTDGSTFQQLTDEVQFVTSDTIYQSPNALPQSADNGTVYATLNNGELPISLYKYNGTAWVLLDQVRTGVLYYIKSTGLVYAFESTSPYWVATSYTNTNQLINGAGFATTQDVGAEATARENADTTLQNNINAKYTKPATGIPKEDLAQAVIDSLNLADSALQSVSSSDVTNALGFTPYNATNPNGYTKVESSTTNGNIKINGSETAVYTLPSEIIATINAKYTKPTNGIPKTDLAQGVQDSLDAADNAQSNITALQTAVNTINGKIPSQATSSNQLADKNFVNSSINAFAAYYITKNAAGDPFATKAELNAATTFYSGGAVRTPTTNDYCIVLADETKQSETGVDPTTRYSYQSNQWEYQYTINDTPLTAAQLSAINSGVTSATVSQVTTNANNISSLQTGKQDKLTAGTNITIDPNTNTISATGGSSITSINGLAGGTLTSPLTITGGYGATASKIILDTNGNITDSSTATLFGRTDNGASLLVGHSSHALKLRGSATRPTYNGNNLALVSDVPTVSSVLLQVYPIGAIYMSVNNTNPGTLFGGTWVAWGAGRVPVGIGNNGETNYTTVESTGGSENSVAIHSHSASSSGGATTTGTTTGSFQIAASGNAKPLTSNYSGFSTFTAVTGGSANNPNTYSREDASKSNRSKVTLDHSHSIPAHSHTITVDNAGSSGGNRQPYITCYMWKRTA